MRFKSNAQRRAVMLSVKRLPVVNYKNQKYFVDFRLNELRNAKTARSLKFTNLQDDAFKAKLRGIRFRTWRQEYIRGLDD